MIAKYLGLQLLTESLRETPRGTVSKRRGCFYRSGKDRALTRMAAWKEANRERDELFGQRR